MVLCESSVGLVQASQLLKIVEKVNITGGGITG